MELFGLDYPEPMWAGVIPKHLRWGHIRCSSDRLEALLLCAFRQAGDLSPDCCHLM